MKKTFLVVMLPTEKASPLLISSERDTKNQLLFAKNYNFDIFDYNKNFRHTNKQHLYIISDEKIKEGDWYIQNTGYDIRIRQCKKVQNYNIIPKDENTPTISTKNDSKKIVATTDKSLYTRKVYKESEGGREGKLLLPQLPESFIQAYIKAYNEGKPITEVDLEVESGFTKGNMLKMSEYYCNIKTRPDNTVIVHKSKMYTRDEVVNLICNIPFDIDLFYGEGSLNKWIQDNL